MHRHWSIISFKEGVQEEARRKCTKPRSAKEYDALIGKSIRWLYSQCHCESRESIWLQWGAFITEPQGCLLGGSAEQAPTKSQPTHSDAHLSKTPILVTKFAALHYSAAAGSSSGGVALESASGHWAEYGTPHWSSPYTFWQWLQVFHHAAFSKQNGGEDD